VCIALQTQREINQAPSVKDKAYLLIRLMQCVEKRFSEDTELIGQFLDLVNYIYRYR
jgi:transformation/transcription domain-associated protein